MPIYVNPTRLYNGKLTLYEAALEQRGTLTINPNFTCGGVNGTWDDDPFLELPSSAAPLSAAIIPLLQPLPHTVAPDDATLEHLFQLVKQQIREAWQPDAFHMVMCSAGYDSRIIAASIRALLTEYGASWLGRGLLLLSNRWEAATFRQLMQLLEFPAHTYVAFDVGPKSDHYSYGVYAVWRCAPIPIPANQWWYLITWAQQAGWLPLDEGQLQCFTGLWANETWDAWLAPTNPWEQYNRSWYGRNVMATLPVKARWVEYPLASVPVLDSLRSIDYNSGSNLRRLLSEHAFPASKGIPNPSQSDCKHALGIELRERLQQSYNVTWLSRYRSWSCPKTSEYSTAWGWWSVALLCEQLRAQGLDIRYP